MDLAITDSVLEAHSLEGMADLYDLIEGIIRDILRLDLLHSNSD